jgi:hypothetical protein
VRTCTTLQTRGIRPHRNLHPPGHPHQDSIAIMALDVGVNTRSWQHHPHPWHALFLKRRRRATLNNHVEFVARPLRTHDDYAPAGSVVLLYSAGLGTKAETALDRIDGVPFLASSTASPFTTLSCAKPLTVHYHLGVPKHISFFDTEVSTAFIRTNWKPATYRSSAMPGRVNPFVPIMSRLLSHVHEAVGNMRGNAHNIAQRAKLFAEENKLEASSSMTRSSLLCERCSQDGRCR